MLLEKIVNDSILLYILTYFSSIKIGEIQEGEMAEGSKALAC